MSGWLMFGLPGAMYFGGMSEIWLPIGLAIGAYLNWQFVAKPLRLYTEVSTILLRFQIFLKIVFAIIQIFFVLSQLLLFFVSYFYTSSSLVSGAILLENSFGMDYKLALWVGAAVILSYTLFGGFLAASWTDFIQGILMFLALIIVPIVAIYELGGWNETVRQIGNIDPSHLDVYAGATTIGVISLLAWGLGYLVSLIYLFDLWESINKRRSKSTFNWNDLDDSFLIWSRLCWFCGYCLFCRFTPRKL